MVAAVHFFASNEDTSALLDYLEVGVSSEIWPWPLVSTEPVALSRREATLAGSVIVSSQLPGGPTVIREGDAEFKGASRSALFNRLNLARTKPGLGVGLVDTNSSPVIFWQRGEASATELTLGSIGSQADSMRAVSADYERWVNRVMNWVRGRGTPVWGLQGAAVRPDLAIDVRIVNTLFALPGALQLLESGAVGRERKG